MKYTDYMDNKTVALLLTLTMLMNPAMGHAAPTIPGFYGKITPPAVNTLPVPKNSGSGGVTIDQSGNQMTVTQNQGQANVTIDWSSFNIGAASTVRFYQGAGTPGTATWKPDSSYAALNRIYDKNPSLIFGKLQADGKVYLINQNGIIFGPGSQVIGHSLIASTLNLRDPDFKKGILNFTADNYQDPTTLTPPDSQAMVVNYGAIQTDQGGKVYLIGPDVENYGTITTPLGVTRLISALPYLNQRPSDSALFDLQVDSADIVTYNKYIAAGFAGFAANRNGGIISADAGSVGLYGGTVNQEGIIRAVTTIKNNGRIELHATKRIYMAPGSQTLTPVSGSKDTLLETSNFLSGQITLSGLSTDDTTNHYTSLGTIEHWGSISAPSGQVTLDAKDRVFLGSGSSIDVGGIWVDEPAGANIVTAQLNSVELNNDYGQKGGSLQGQNVNVNPVQGTAIGNINGSYTSRELTARERSTTGGAILIGNASNADALAELIVKDGATLNFTGGGFRYASGSANTTMLLSGINVAPLSAAAEWTTYDKILGQLKIVNSKFGTTESYTGLYMGGGAPVGQLSGSYVQGSDAGALTLQARLQVLDGSLNGAAVIGPYQTKITTDADTRQLTIAEGIEKPLGGTLVIGTTQYNPQNPAINDFILGDTVMEQHVPQLVAGFGPTDALPQSRQQTTLLSAAMFNSAGLNNLTITTNTALTVDADAHLELPPGASMTVNARKVDLLGSVRIPSGSVNVTLRGNITEPATNPGYIEVDERISLEKGSSIDVSGERIDNSHRVMEANPQTGGGTISLVDLTDYGYGVAFNHGASLDVSGGYVLNANGKSSGGNAGGLTLAGNNLLIYGELSGLAMAGSNGGKLTLQAGVVSLGPIAGIPSSGGISPADDPGGLFISPGQLVYSGFSQLTIKSRSNLTVGAGVDLAPSLARYSPPVQGTSGAVGNATDGVSAAQNLVVDPLIAGPTSMSLAAGSPFDTSREAPRDIAGGVQINSVLTLAAGSSLRTTPGGSITLTGPAIALNGILESQGGTVAVTSQNNLVLGTYAQILAGGYNRADSTNVGGVTAGWNPQPGGKVTLTAVGGSLDIERGSVIDVSGSQPVTVNVKGSDGLPAPITAAGAAGQISLSYAQGVALDGELLGKSYLAGLQGGTFAIRNSAGSMTLSSSDVAHYQGWGFDDLTFGAAGSLNFSGDMTISARHIKFDAPLLTGAGTSAVVLKAPWIEITNITNKTVSDYTLTSGGARLSLTADWIDLHGALNASGFQVMDLSARNDIRLFDNSYQSGLTQPLPDTTTKGLLNTSGDLVLDAARTYSTTLNQFSFVSAGKITVFPHAAGTSPVVSAGGVLNMSADKGIDVQGTLLAPMGQIVLTSSNGRVLLEPGSVVSTSGGSPVPYGQLTADGVWEIQSRDFAGQYVDVAGAPASSIQLTGKEVVVQGGARVDASGGGSVFSAVWQSGIAGSNNPLTIPGRYVIMPDNSVSLPGKAIYLAGGGGVAAGLYSILPAGYAFLPGAMVVTDLGMTVAKGVQQKSADGNTVVAGYFKDQGSGTQQPFFEGFTIRPAISVLKEGNFTTQELVAGNGGKISLNGTTTVLNGSVSAIGLAGFSGGTLEMGGKNVTIGQAAAVLPGQFDFSTPLPAYLTGSTILSTASFEGKGFQSLSLGVSGVTDTVTVSAGSTVDVQKITITADHNITLGSGSQLRGIGADGTGSVSLTAGTSTTAGAVTMADNTVIHAGDAFALTVSGLTSNAVVLSGAVSVDKGMASITGDRITLLNDGDTNRSGGGIFLTQTQWNAFKAVSSLTLTSRSDLKFQGNLNLNAGGDVTIDAARITGAGNVVLKATGLSLLNSGANSGPGTEAATGTLIMQADHITVGTGSTITVGTGGILFDGFGQIGLLAKNDLTLQGTGSILTGWNTYNPSQTLELQGARIVSALAPSIYSDGSTTYSPANFTIDASNGTLAVTSSGAAPAAATAPGGYLSLTANQVAISGAITAPGGTLVVTTSDKDPSAGISLTGNASLNLAGLTVTPAPNAVPSSIPGGKVELMTVNGTLTMAQGTGIDVSGSGGSDAGAIVMYAPHGADVQGDLKGNSNGGQGGAFTLYSDKITNLNGLAGKLSAGGFTSTIDLRAHNNDLTLDSGYSLSAGDIHLTADSGTIKIAGTISAIADPITGNGGSVELYAGNNLTVSGSIIAAGTGSGQGGNVVLSSEPPVSGAVIPDPATAIVGSISLNTGAINVRGGSGGRNGTVTLRALWKENADGTYDLPINLANNSITDAQQVVAQGVKVYGPLLNAVDFSSMFTDMSAIMTNNGSSVWNTLSSQSGLGSNVLHLRPELEVRTSGNLSLKSDIIITDFASDSADPPNNRFSFNINGVNAIEPGNLTLRAGGNLTVNHTIIDAPTDPSALSSSNLSRYPSWGISLVAGADLSSADPMAIVPKTGTLTINDNIRVYTESSSLSFASGGNTSIGAGTASNFIPNNLFLTVGTYDGSVRGEVGGDLTLQNGGIIQTATGPIAIEVGGNLNFSSSVGAIRTTGEVPPDLVLNWSYVNGGNLSLDVTGQVAGKINTTAWDMVDNSFHSWLPNVSSTSGSKTTAGIVTLGGGNLSIRSGEGFNGQAGTFGQGNFTLISGGNVSGRFLCNQGAEEIVANGNFGDAANPTKTVLEVCNSKTNVIAGGRIDLGTILNPSEALLDPVGIWSLTYTPDTSVRLNALAGDITLAGSSYYVSTATPHNPAVVRILPPSVELYAAGTINLLNNFTLAPSPTGTLRLAAGGSVSGLYTDSSGNEQHSQLIMSDLDPATVYIYQKSTGSINLEKSFFNNILTHAATPVHTADATPILISAGLDVLDLQFYFPKQADIMAGRDVRDIYAKFQNLASTDKTEVVAGRDVVFSAGNAAYKGDEGLFCGGPGLLLVQAGRDVDLGTSLGIQTIGNYDNPALGSKGSTTIVAAGIAAGTNDLSKIDAEKDTSDFFDALRQAGSEYASLLASGKTAQAIAAVEEVRIKQIIPRFTGGTNNGAGSINMTNSSISSLSGQDDIYILASSEANVGKSTFGSSNQLQASGNFYVPPASTTSTPTGIYTASGGAINIFTGGDLNVNESRVMTYLGGSITAWSDEGSINAGRGSKTTINSLPPQNILTSPKGAPQVFKTVFTPPSAGSGIRALSYDLNIPPGDINLFAPQGVIDAGEAGIAGGKVTLGATEVLNSQNIAFSAGSVGVPSSSAGAVSIGSLSGTSGLADSSKMIEQTSGAGAARDALKNSTQVLDDFMSKFLDVKVISFDQDDDSNEKEKEKDKR